MFGKLSKGIVAWLLGVVLALGMLAPAVAPAQAQTPAVRAALSYNPCAGVTLNLDFTAKGGQGLYCLNGQRFGSFLAIPGASFTRASSGTAQDAAGNVIAFASGVPRVTNQGLLVEEGRTNLLLRSTDFTNAAWDKEAGFGGAISANTVVAPDGTLTASAYTWPSNTANFATLAQSVSGNAAQPQAYSVWLKVPGATKQLRLAVSNVTTTTATGSLLAVTSTWQRFTFLVSAAALANTGQIGVGFNVGGSGVTIATGDIIQVWNEQLEANATFATSDIFTTSAAATRAADVPLITGLAISLKQGGMRTTWKQSAQKAQVSGLVAVDGGDGVNNRVQSFLDSSGKVGWRYSVAGADQIGADGSATVGAGVHKAGVAWSSAGFFGYVDGAQDITGALTPAATTLDTANVGVTISAHAALNDYLQSFSVYAAPPSTAQLQAFTQ